MAQQKVTAGQVDTLNQNTTGNAATATKLATSRNINGVAFDGTANITINAVDSTARIAATEKGVANGVATLDASGLVPSAQLPAYVDSIVEYANFAAFPGTGVTGTIYVAVDTGLTYRWSGTTYTQIVSGAVTSVAGKTGAVTLDKADVGLSNVDNVADASKSVASAAILTTTRTINGVSFNGSANIIIADSTKQPLDADLTAIAALVGTTGLLRKTAADTWSLDNTGYTANLGTVTEVTGTAPIVSSGGTTPAISISPATTSVPGSMSAADKTKLDGLTALPIATDTVLGGIKVGSGLAIDGFGVLAATGSGGSVTTVSVTSANGVSGTVATATTTPAITLTLGAITPTTIVASSTIQASNFAAGASVTNTNTGDNATNSQYSGLVTNATHTGDVTGSTALTIAGNVVTNAKLATITTSTMKGRLTAGTGNVEDLSAAQVRTLINVQDGANNYSLPIAAAGSLGGIRVGTGLAIDGSGILSATGSGGTVTSVAMTVPTGLSVSGTPISTSGTLAITLQAGYSIPSTASQTNWNAAYDGRLQWDGGNTNLNAAAGRTSLQGTTVGQNMFMLGNPGALTYPRLNADNTVTAISGATLKSEIAAASVPTYYYVATTTTKTYATGLTLSTTDGRVQVFRNGVLLRPGSGNGYTISGSSVVLEDAPETGDELIVYAFN